NNFVCLIVIFSLLKFIIYKDSDLSQKALPLAFLKSNFFFVISHFSHFFHSINKVLLNAISEMLMLLLLDQLLKGGPLIKVRI
ncbi:hypothetical protein ACJX0J_025229, partial [Zea mays]